MGRTKIEIDAITSKIMDVIQEQQVKREKSFVPEAKKQYEKKLKSLIKEKNIILKKIAAEAKKLGISNYPYYNDDEDSTISYLATKLAKNKEVDVDIVEREVILAGDVSSDQLIKKISEMFL